MCATPPCSPRPRCLSTLVALIRSEMANMEIGDRVEVHTRFNNTWVAGFEVAAVVGSELSTLSDIRRHGAAERHE